VCSVTFPPRKPCPLWVNVEKYGRARQATDDNIIRRMRVACWIRKATNTYPEYVILIAFPLQKLLHEHTSILRFYIYGLSCFNTLMLQFPRASLATCYWLENPVLEFGQGQETFLLSKTSRSTMDKNESSNNSKFYAFMVCYRVNCAFYLFCKFYTAL
jgi:hypothetical protein